MTAEPEFDLDALTTPKIAAYHGTAACFRDEILENGLVGMRQTRGIYFSPRFERAAIYAASWAVGLHAIGEMKKPTGIVCCFEISDGELHQEQRFDFLTKGPIFCAELAGSDKCHSQCGFRLGKSPSTQSDTTYWSHDR